MISWIYILVLKDTHLILYICCNIWCHYCSVAKSRLTLFNFMNCSTPGSSILHYLPELLKFMSTESEIPSNHLISATPFSSHLQSFPASGSFPMSQFFASGGQSIGASASASVLPMNIHDWFPLGWTGWISFKSLVQHHSSKPSILQCSAFFMVQLSDPYMTTRKTIALTVQTFPRCSLIWQASWWCLSVGDLSSSPL